MLNNKISKAVRLAIAFGAASTAAFSANTFAADENTAEEVERIEVTGSAIKRTDMEGSLPVQVINAAEIAKMFQKELVEALFEGGDLENVATKYIEQIRSGRVDHLLIYKKRLGKPLEQYIKNIPPHVKAARDNKNLESKKYIKGTTVNYFISLYGPKVYLNNKVQDVCYEHYIEKQILPILGMFSTSQPSSKVSINQQITLEL